MSYIKQKKIWLKRFTKEELDYIWKSFQSVTPIYSWDTVSFTEALSLSEGFFIHPETDLRDNTMGIEPKRIKKWITTFGLNGLEEVLLLLQAKATMDYNFRQSFLDNDSMVLWDSIWKEHVSFTDSVEDSVIACAKSLGLLNSKNSEDLLFDNPWIVFYKKEDLKSYIGKQEIVWKRSFGHAPKSLAMLFINPDRFHINELHVIESLFGSKQIANLSKTNQFYASLFIAKFGSIADSVDLTTVIRKVRLPEPFIMEGLSSEDAKKAMKLSKDFNGLDVNISKKIVLGGLEDSMRNHLKTLERKESSLNIKESFINLVIELVQRSKESPVLLKTLDLVLQSDPTHLYEMSSFLKRPLTITDMSALENIWVQRSTEQLVEIVSGTVKKYSYSMLDSVNDTTGLFLGHITDCCQVPGDTGGVCLVNGFQDPTSTFFAIKKKNKVYAQSWVWTATYDGKKILCFDSLEVLGDNINKSDAIIDCYVEAAQKYIELGYDYVICGSDGQHIPAALEKAALAHYEEEDDMYDLLSYKGPCQYTDTEELGLFVLAQKE